MLLISAWTKARSLLPRVACSSQAWLAGVKDDGTPKIRGITDLSFSEVNISTAATEKLKYDNLDKLFAILKMQTLELEVGLLKLVATLVHMFCEGEE